MNDTRFEDRGDFLQIFWETDSLFSNYHYFWLRHNCSCCVHPMSKERILCPSNVPMDIRPNSVSANDNHIRILWPDGHVSDYLFDWLDEFQYSTNEVIPRIEAQDLSLVEVSFPDCSGSLTSICKSYLDKRGAILVRGCSMDAEDVVEEFLHHGFVVRETHFGRIEDLKTDNSTNANTDQLGYTDAAIDFHTDQPFIEQPPNLQMLYCVDRGTTGGGNQLVDAKQAALYLRGLDRHAFDLLVNTPIQFDRKQQSFASQTLYPILTFEDGEFRQVRSSYFTLAPLSLSFDLMEPWYRAYQKFIQIINEPAHQFRFVLNPGDFILYDNHRMLHARDGFTGPRWMKGVYFDRI